MFFGLYATTITDSKLEQVSDTVEAITYNLNKIKGLRKVFNSNFNLDKLTYGFTDYGGYGYLINSPKVFGGVWLNLIITPNDPFESNYVSDVRVRITLRDKDDKSVLYEYAKIFSVTFNAELGYGVIADKSIFIEETVIGLPPQVYLCIDVPLDYKLNVTTNNSSTKFMDVLTLDNSYPNLFLGTNAKYQVSNGLYRYTCDIGIYDISYQSNSPKITLHDAFMKWCDGEKFPIAFAGDSTTDGYRTTGYVANVLGTDHTSGYLYTDILQSLLRKETGNNNLRIYNAGFSGKTASWMVSNFDAEFGTDSAYSDTQMIGISFGINDRPKTEEQYNVFKQNVRRLCNKCLDNGIQPFLLTSQAGAENSDVLGRYESVVISYANRAKWELAKELNLEIIDVSTLTANFLNYSNKPIQTILYDYCHFADYGHKYEGGMFFREFVPRTITIDIENRIGFETQGIKSDLQWGDTSVKQVQMLSTVYNGFKTKAHVLSRTDTSDIVILDVWVFIDGKKPLTLKTYCGVANTLHCLVDDADTVITSTEQTISELDLGLHHIVIKSGTSANIDFYGCKLV